MTSFDKFRNYWVHDAHNRELWRLLGMSNDINKGGGPEYELHPEQIAFAYERWLSGILEALQRTVRERIVL